MESSAAPSAGAQPASAPSTTASTNMTPSEPPTFPTYTHSFPGCFPEENPVDNYRTYISTELAKIAGVDATTIYPVLSWTAKLEHGDLSLPVPALRIKGSKPAELAEKWAKEFPENPYVQPPKADGPYLKFFFNSQNAVHLALSSVFKRKEAFGDNAKLGLKDPQDSSKGRKKIVIEFSSPNIAKPFHAGHLRSTIIGGFLSKLYAGAGWEVVRLNYLGDWGKQYGLLALGFKRHGDEKALEENPIGHLFEIYVKINKELEAEKTEIKRLEDNGEDATQVKEQGLDEQARQYFKAMCDNDAAALAQWKKFRELSITKYKQAYGRLNITFDEYVGESMVTPESMARAEKEMIDSGLAETSEGALLIDFTKHVAGKPGKSLGKALIRKRDGTSLYLTRDIGELLSREEKYRPDRLIYVVAQDQEVHLKQLFKIIELTGHKELAEKTQHVTFGLVQGMSTRRGTVKFLDDILRDVGDEMHEVMRKNEVKYSQVDDPAATADVLGISSVMTQDMTGKRINNYTFNMDVMTSFEGDTGPYLQYAHARLCSIFRKAGISRDELATADLAPLVEPHAVNLARLLAQWPDVTRDTLRTLEPTTLLTYMFRMTHMLSSSYDVLKVLGSEPATLRARLALYDAARQVLANGMRLLGLTPVDRM